MGLTYKSCKIKSLEDSFNIKQKENSYVVALAGNPNTGKSTVFNYHLSKILNEINIIDGLKNIDCKCS